MNWRDYIAVDPEVCHGRACIAGAGAPVTVVLDNLAAGRGADDIVRSYPTVSREAVRAVLLYAAEMAKERTMPLAG